MHKKCLVRIERVPVALQKHSQQSAVDHWNDRIAPSQSKPVSSCWDSRGDLQKLPSRCSLSPAYGNTSLCLERAGVEEEEGLGSYERNLKSLRRRNSLKKRKIFIVRINRDVFKSALLYSSATGPSESWQSK